MDTPLEHLVFRMMDMTADNAVAPLGLGIRSKIRLKTGNRGNSLLDLVLDDCGKRIILLSPLLACLVPDIIELQQKIIGDIAEFSQESQPRSDTVEGMSMDTHIRMILLLDDEFMNKADIGHFGRNQRIQEIVMITGNINHLRIMLFHHLHYHMKES